MCSLASLISIPNAIILLFIENDSSEHTKLELDYIWFIINILDENTVVKKKNNQSFQCYQNSTLAKYSAARDILKMKETGEKEENKAA